MRSRSTRRAGAGRNAAPLCRMQGFLQRAALEGFVRGGGSWQQIQHSLPNLEMTLDPTRPVAMVLGKDTAARQRSICKA